LQNFHQHLSEVLYLVPCYTSHDHEHERDRGKKRRHGREAPSSSLLLQREEDRQGARTDESVVVQEMRRAERWKLYI
jgi:hypothetical protein